MSLTILLSWHLFTWSAASQLAVPNAKPQLCKMSPKEALLLMCVLALHCDACMLYLRHATRAVDAEEHATDEFVSVDPNGVSELRQPRESRPCSNYTCVPLDLRSSLQVGGALGRALVMK